jgi:hypothetical protein
MPYLALPVGFGLYAAATDAADLVAVSIGVDKPFGLEDG